jgi:NADPH:quinone reductase-like Zn-dependent oxidoreductase
VLQRIAKFDQVGEMADFMIGSAPLGALHGDEVRFKIAAFGLNQADLLLTEGRHYVRVDLPIRLGYEGCGTVVEVGREVTRFRPGDRVTAIPNVDGPYWTAGEFAIARENFLTGWPEGWTAAEAASLWMPYLTPFFPFAELFPFEPGEWVMITAASGGTGLGSIAMARLLGARVIATTRTPAKAQVLRDHGADAVLSTEDADFGEQVAAITGGDGVRLIADSLCGAYVPMLARTLADGGRMFIHGALGGSNTLSLPILDLVHRGAGIYGYSLINALRQPDALARGRDFVRRAVSAGKLPRPRIDRIFPFAQDRDAYSHLRGGSQTGKIIVSLEAEPA